MAFITLTAKPPNIPLKTNLESVPFIGGQRAAIPDTQIAIALTLPKPEQAMLSIIAVRWSILLTIFPKMSYEINSVKINLQPKSFPTNSG